MNFAITLFSKPILLKGAWTPDLRAHEEVHAAQQEKHGFFTYLSRYVFDSDFRLCVEVEAYKASIKHGLDPRTAASLMAKWYYFLNVTPENALELLTNA